jgi:thiamine pyrophosphate-dependent acetolactate synthase large subunit-like protein
VFFVFVDESWSAIRLGQTLLYGGRHVGTDIARCDYAALAEACGCAVRSVERPAELTEVVAAAAAHREPRPLVIAIRMRKDHIPFAGANFVLAELDGALRSLAPAAARSFVRSLVRGPLSLRDFLAQARVGR